MNPDKCVDLLNSIIGDKEKFDITKAGIDVEIRIITDREQIYALENLTNNAIILRGFVEKNNSYISIPPSISPNDKEKLLAVASQTCYDNVLGMINYLGRLKEEYTRPNLIQDEPKSALQRYLKQKKEERFTDSKNLHK